ncbi:MAG: AAA family ATPase [Candidatus Heimdallarchaeota archaeon]
MKVIGFCGLPGSGKSTALKAIQDLGIIINMGDIVRDEAERRNLNPNDQNLGEIAKELREKHGKDIIAKKCVQLIKSMKAEVVFVDGIRSAYEIDVFRKHWKFPVIEIATKNAIRYKRILGRSRSDDPIALSNIIERDDREIEFGIKEVLSLADYKIVNNSTKEKLNRKTRKLLLKVLKNY